MIWRIRPVAGLLLCQSNRQGSGPELSPNPFLHACLPGNRICRFPSLLSFFRAHPFLFRCLSSPPPVCSLSTCLYLEHLPAHSNATFVNPFFIIYGSHLSCIFRKRGHNKLSLLRVLHCDTSTKKHDHITPQH